ncbi:hypothetical protein [Mucilaginibacter myungsuensis]|uniref:Uncharacterized protein n=1 Tax=Mucilaginibacter myungsuensis TaxID=649104 RepID=A0A929PW71_9SPHI|nr:hypothetical protein [Mucilaginibacter myungsuensis]MBE9661849.1 hypothetical protein [Mucilaginibacter myungsuensis]MDN3599717.1 hypothetical protein [Mucilaginibacter myungsuensis]
MTKDLSIETRKKLFVLLSIFYLFFTGWQCYRNAQRSLERGVYLNVNLRANTGLGTYNNHVLADGRGTYTTGTQGELYWRPRSLTEAAMLNVIGGHVADLVDVFTVLVLSGAILYTFKGSRDGAVFTKRMVTGFAIVISLVVLIEVVAELVRLKVGHNYIAYITHNRFSAIVGGKLTPGGILLPLLGFLSIIPTKALEQQKEAELTI